MCDLPSQRFQAIIYGVSDSFIELIWFIIRSYDAVCPIGTDDL